MDTLKTVAIILAGVGGALSLYVWWKNKPAA